MRQDGRTEKGTPPANIEHTAFTQRPRPALRDL
jgi:hypothetical protein